MTYDSETECQRYWQEDRRMNLAGEGDLCAEEASSLGRQSRRVVRVRGCVVSAKFVLGTATRIGREDTRIISWQSYARVPFCYGFNHLPL